MGNGRGGEWHAQRERERERENKRIVELSLII